MEIVFWTSLAFTKRTMCYIISFHCDAHPKKNVVFQMTFSWCKINQSTQSASSYIFVVYVVSVCCLKQNENLWKEKWCPKKKQKAEFRWWNRVCSKKNVQKKFSPSSITERNNLKMKIIIWWVLIKCAYIYILVFFFLNWPQFHYVHIACSGWFACCSA